MCSCGAAAGGGVKHARQRTCLAAGCTPAGRALDLRFCLPAVGTIFGIYKAKNPGSGNYSLDDVMRVRGGSSRRCWRVRQGNIMCAAARCAGAQARAPPPPPLRSLAPRWLRPATACTAA
jgi:hypothetical protein